MRIIYWSSDVCSSDLLYSFHLAEFGESDSGPAAINAVEEGRDRRFKAGIVADRPDPANARHPADRLCTGGRNQPRRRYLLEAEYHDRARVLKPISRHQIAREPCRDRGGRRGESTRA